MSRNRAFPGKADSLPALWYYILCLALILTSLFVVQRRGKPEPAGETVADLLASDRPLQAGDPDPLNQHHISSGPLAFPHKIFWPLIRPTAASDADLILGQSTFCP